MNVFKKNQKLEKIKVIITGAGAPGIAGTIYSLRNNPDKTVFEIITTDVFRDVVGKFLSDKFYKVPPPEDKNYIRVIEQIFLREKAHVLIPQTTRETIVLSKHKKYFDEKKMVIATSPYESIKIANDKYLLLEKARKIKIPIPDYHIAKSKEKLIEAVKLLGYPKKKVVIKPRVSNGMRGFRILTEESWNVQRFLAEKPDGIEMSLNSLLDILHNGNWPELLVLEYLPGEEFTLDVFYGKKGVFVVPRLREKIRSGITFDARIDLRDDIINYSCRLAEHLNLKYCFGFQFKLSEKGVPKIIECNPRVQGTMVASTFAGFNMVYFSVMEALGKKIDFEKINIKNNMRFIRYWGGVGIDEKGIVGRI